MCFENGVHYNIGDSFRNGSFKLVCKKDGVVIEGIFSPIIFSYFYPTLKDMKQELAFFGGQIGIEVTTRRKNFIWLDKT